jgi:hypothetical protein
VRRAITLDQLLNGRVPYRGKLRGIKGTKVLADLMAGPKTAWTAAVEAMADERFPAWRDHFRKTGRRMPLEMRKDMEPRSAWAAQRPLFIKGLLEWLGSSSGPDIITEISNRLDAVLEFTIFVTREFLLRNYSPEKHESDVFDQFQLQYLAMDKFVIVSGDPDLSTRTKLSSQASRIMSFDEFLRTI